MANVNEVIEVLIGQVCAVSKVRRNSYGQKVVGLLVKDRDTKEEGWVNYTNFESQPIKYADYVQVDYKQTGAPVVHLIDVDGYNF
jgi:hypothetical protein